MMEDARELELLDLEKAEMAIQESWEFHITEAVECYDALEMIRDRKRVISEELRAEGR